jgi:hypothetical protein
MAVTVIKNDEHHAIVKIIGDTTNTISLASLTYQAVAPVGAMIKSVFYSSDPNDAIEIIRNTPSPVALLDLWGSGYIDFMEKFGCPISTSSNQNIGVNPKNASNNHFTIILHLLKQI